MQRGTAFAVCICLVSLALTSACAEKPQEALRFGLASAPVNLDPRFATDATSVRINRLLYERLVDFDETVMPVPALATWEKLTPIHYRVTLGSEGREFHDGNRLTAVDVKATYEFILDPDHASPHRASLIVIDRIETLDDHTVDFYLNKEDALFPSYLVIGILPARLIAQGHAFHSNPVGSGPFAFVAWPDEGRLQLVRQQDGQQFEFLRVSDPTVRVLKLLTGEIDMLQNDLPPELVLFLAKDNRVRLQQAKGDNFTYLGFNFEDPLVGRTEVREAIAHAIDRKAIIQYVFGGAARPANAILPPDHWAGYPSGPGYAYDPQKARILLAQAGFNHDSPIRLTHKTSGDPFRLRLATVLQHQLAQVGVHVEIQSYDWGTFYSDIKAGRFQMYSLSWVGIKTPDIFSYAFHSHSVPPTGANRGRFVSQTADHLIEQAEGAQDIQEKGSYYRRLQAHLLETLPYVPLCYEDHVFIARDMIEGYRVAGDGNYDSLRYVYGRSTMQTN